MPKELHWSERPFALVPTPQYKADKPDMFETCATGMALAHNMILRGLNSIYQQAPWIQQRDTQDFLEYCKLWLQVITVHHSGEEKHFFPYIESATGIPNLMDVNREQHDSFHDGIQELEDYVNSALKEEEFNGSRVITIIDGFGELLREHLSNEIDSLLSLGQYGDKLSGLKEALDQEAKKNMETVSITGGLVMALLLHDKSWEDGKWANFPPAPALVTFGIRKVLYHLHSSWWRFAPCDNNALPKAQYALPPQA